MEKDENISENLPTLIIQKELDSNIQIVCNYLKLLKIGKLSEKDLIIEGISLSRNDIKEIINNDIIKEDTTIDAKPLDEKECEALIKDVFKNKLKIESPNYFQINLFINILAGQLKKFSINFTLTAANLIQNGILLKKPTLKNVRELIINSFIINVKHFTFDYFSPILRAQQGTNKIKIDLYMNENKNEEIISKVISELKNNFSCDKISPYLVLFNIGDQQDFTIISMNDSIKEEYEQLLQLRKSIIMSHNEEYGCYGLNRLKVPIPNELKNYRKFKHDDFLKEIKEIFSLKNPVYNCDKNSFLNSKSIEEIAGDYIFTADNFIKMILILLRERENVPIILMGETGCGKTSLIRKLYELMNNGENNMEILNIHAGVTNEEIIYFLSEEKEIDGRKVESIITKAKILGKKEKRIKKEYYDRGQVYTTKKLWVFFDGINSSSCCLDIIIEIMTKHSCQGEKLPDNIFFIGACPPFRYGKEKERDYYLLKNRKLKERKLIYNVYPLPISLLNFVVNFGNISPEDEKCYIKNMVSKKIEHFFWKEVKEKFKDNEDFKSEELKRLSINAIIEAQNFIRNKNDISSVSLRNIKHFCIFYDFYVEYYIKNKKLAKNKNQKEFLDEFRDYYLNLNKNDIYKNSIKLSLYICYYLRIPTMELRQEFSKKMNSIFGDEFLEIAKHEQQYIAKNLEIKKGIIKNRIFLENIFALFSCINAKIPLFIVGELGSGKNIACQILSGAMKGDSSDNSLFKSLPKLFINSYQGSSSSTSKGIFHYFNRAKNMINYNNKEHIVSMLLFNDIGIAELSPYNPLKVLNYELDNDLNKGDEKISFVGLSNWVLDETIMNRGILLSIPPLEKNELEMTAINIAESYNEKLAQDNKDFFITLANTYFEYKKILEKEYPDKKDFHGLKDFYHLIKTAMKLILKMKEEVLDIYDNVKQERGLTSIERNFGGLEFCNDKNQTITSLEIIKNIFKKVYVNSDITKKYFVLQRICENIKDKYSRYLLLTIREPILKYLILSIFNTGEINKNFNKDLSFYIGSYIDEDINSERYYNKILNNIQFQMKQNKILILSDLNKIYPCLIELFKQNYVEIGSKMFSRILIGSGNITSSLVDDGFKCIVLFDEKNLDKELPCFINAFEKHLITFDYLLYKEFSDESEKIYNMIQNFFDKDIDKQLNINKKLNLSAINWTKEKIKEIIYLKYLEYEKLGKRLFIQDLLDLFLENYSNTLSQDMIFLLKNSNISKKYPEIAEKIIHFYKIGEHLNIYNFLTKIKSTKNVIYTFTDIDEPILPYNIIDFETELLGKIKRNNIKEIKMSSISNENELEKYLDKIYREDKNIIKIIIIKFNDENKKNINYIMYFLENYINDINEIKNDIEGKNKKAFILSVHMKRTMNIDVEGHISNAFNFNQIFIDDLNGEDISILDIINLKEEEKNLIKERDEDYAKNEINIFLKNNYKEIVDKEISI